MGKQIAFKSEDGTELQSHVNTKVNAVIVLNQDSEFLVYVFDDELEIDELIEHLKEVKQNLITYEQ